MLGVPKTIDNDLGGTDMTFGFDTAVQIATDAIDRLHTTAESHNRVMIVEVMGRHAGWIALHSGLAGGADVILIPERPFDIDEVCRLSAAGIRGGATSRSWWWPRERCPRRGRWRPCREPRTNSVTRAWAGSGSCSSEIESRTGYESRATVLGHIQRGGTPTAFDRVLADPPGRGRRGRGRRGRWGVMPALRGRIELVPLAEAVAELRTVPEDYEAAATFFG